MTPGVIVYVDTAALGALLIEQLESNALVDRGGNRTADALVSSDLLETELRRIACLGGDRSGCRDPDSRRGRAGCS